MTNQLAYNALNESFLDPLFVLKTQQQIAKDFLKVNLQFPEKFNSEVFSKEEILLLIENEIATISERGERHLLQLLYAIDLSEKTFLKLTLQPDFLSKISEQILMREAYKVWLRTKYS
jgi:hypothetical protein|tara:strand:- start:47464 stop:47817 length:354 start_codon:yes stop_codon:yes gene_type:complete